MTKEEKQVRAWAIAFYRATQKRIAAGKWHGGAFQAPQNRPAFSRFAFSDLGRLVLEKATDESFWTTKIIRLANEHARRLP